LSEPEEAYLWRAIRLSRKKMSSKRNSGNH